MKKNDFKYEIGQEFKDCKRNLVITDKEYREYIHKPDKKGRVYIQNEKWYKYTCNVCNWTEGWVKEGNLNKGNGCSCCNGKTVVPNINSIWAKAHWMIDLGVSIEDAKNYLPSSMKKVVVTCPDCGAEKEYVLNNIYTNKSIGCICSDGKSYPEKFITKLLLLLGIKFKAQLSKATFDWCESKKYDFYIPNINTIIEAHGEQHYEEHGVNSKFKTLEEEQENDRFKEELALANGIDKYIVIDCRYSNVEWIKNSILNSKLNEMFDLSNIDWNECGRFASSNIIKEVCEYWNNNKVSVKEIANKFALNRRTVSEYLNIGTELGWANYDGKKEYKKHCTKPVAIFKNDVLLDTFNSTTELDNTSMEVFGVRLERHSISNAIKNNKPYKGFTFKYATEKEENNLKESA